MALTTSNSFVTTTEADLYMETRIDSANYIDASSELQESALVTATEMIDNSQWIGVAVSSTQSLGWPRSSASYYDKRMGQVITIADTVLAPEMVKRATYELALHLIDNPDILQQASQTFEKIQVGPIIIEDTNADVKRQLPIFPARIRRIFQMLVVRGGQSQWWRAN